MVGDEVEVSVQTRQLEEFTTGVGLTGSQAPWPELAEGSNHLMVWSAWVDEMGLQSEIETEENALDFDTATSK